MIAFRPQSVLSFTSINEISSIGEPQTPDERGSLCNRFILEAGLATSGSGGTQPQPLQRQQSYEVTEVLDEEEELRKRPPKIWISKSASMDDDLE